MQREDVIRRYFRAWIDNDIEIVKQTFSENVTYSECYGPEYHGIQQIIKWFTKWNNKGKVLEWTIKRVIQQNNTIVVEWYFKCDYANNIDGFNGVTIADFDDSMRISKLCEFQSKADHYYPYEE
ncbi:nuclear transport factor 2 family protein [Anaerosporobacter sp.]